MKKFTKLIRILLLLILLYVGATSVHGGIGILTGKIALPLEFLNGTPFKSFQIPGIILLVLVGGLNLISAFLVFKKAKYHLEFASFSAFSILIWTFTEIYMIKHTMFLQVIYFSLGIINLCIILLLQKYEKSQ